MLSKRLLAPAFLIGALILAAPPSAQAQWTNQSDNFERIQTNEKVELNTIGVRLWDYWKYLPKVVENLEEVEKVLMNSPEDFLGIGKIKNVYNLFLRANPKVSGTTFLLPLTYFVRDANDVLRFEKVDITYTNAHDIMSTRRESVLLSQTNFRIDVALVDRKAIVSDQSNDLVMVFPIGVGSFDVRVLHDSVSLLTPRFKDAFLDKRTLIYKRDKPRYFAGKPFIRIMTRTDDLEAGWTGIGFHAQPNLASFVRAFDSHGCMRMQLDDLYALYWLVEEGPRQQTRVKVSYYTDSTLDHPFPKRDKPWRQVNNIGTQQEPMYNIDRDGLTQAVLASNSEAPIDELVDADADNYHDLYNYNMDWREKERMQRHELECRELYLTNKANQKLFGIGNRAERKYEKCVKEGRRNLDISDRLYRFWVH